MYRHKLPSSLDCAEISSASEGESKALDLWVNCGAYTVSRSDEGIILSPRGWLTDNIVSAEVFGEAEVHWECKRCVKTVAAPF